MLAALKQFLTDLTGTEDQPPEITEDRCRLAAAALLFHVVAIDGDVAPEEKNALRRVLQERFSLSDSDTAELVEEAEAADREAVDLYSFTSVLKRELGEADRERVIEMMWQVVFADGKVHEFEDNLVWRAAELLGVSSQARIRLKQTVRANEGS